MIELRGAKALKVLSIATLALICLMHAPAFAAACTSPMGNEGDINYSAPQHLMIYCNGTNWITMGESSPISFGTLTTGDLCAATSGTSLACVGTLSGDVISTAGSATVTTVSAIQGTAVTGTTGTGKVVFSTSPTFTGTITAGSSTWSGTIGIATNNPMSELQVNGGEVQIGSSGASCTINNAGAIRYSAGTLYYCNSSAWTASSAGGSSTVNIGSQYQMAYYAANGTAVSGDANIVTDSSNNLNIGTSTTTYGALQIAGMNGISFPTADTDSRGSSVAIGPHTLANMPAMPLGTTTAYYNIAIGQNALSGAGMTTAATQNTAIGVGALGADTSGSGNIALGDFSLLSNTTGVSNTALGSVALNANTTGTSNVAIGAVALLSNQVGGQNVGIGASTLLDEVASGNTAIGYDVMQLATTGNNNTSVGQSSMFALKTGSNNTVIGSLVASTTLTSGSNNILIGNDNTTDTFSGGTSSAIGIGQGVKPGSADIAIGFQALQTNAGDNLGNTAIGFQTMASASMTTAAGGNTALGFQAMQNDTSGGGNTGLGFQALQAGGAGGGDVAVGFGALQVDTTGGGNAAIGFDALQADTTGGGNTASGDSALQATTTGGANTANGFQALGANITGSGNVASGSEAGFSNGSDTGNDNVAIGNNAFGFDSDGISGTDNISIGDTSAQDISTGSNNIAVGSFSLGMLTTGNNNTVLGDNVASTTLTNGSNNILIGTDSTVDTPTATTNNFLNIGNLIYGVNIGTAAIPGKVGIGTTLPGTILDVRGGSFGPNQNFGIQLGVSTGQWLSRFSIKSDSFGNARTAIDATNGAPTGVTNEVISIPANGNVGIGTTAPNYLLTIGSTDKTSAAQIGVGLGGAASNYAMSISGGRVMYGYDDFNGWGVFGGGSGKGFSFYVNGTNESFESGTQAMTIGNSGNVGIGTTAPQSKLQVNGGEVQIGSSGASCSASNAGAIRYSGGTLYYCNSSAWTASNAGGAAGAAGSTGQVQFNTGGALNADAGLFWDNTNKRLGIGSTAPITPLNVVASLSSATAGFVQYPIPSQSANFTDYPSQLVKVTATQMTTGFGLTVGAMDWVDSPSSNTNSVGFTAGVEGLVTIESNAATNFGAEGLDGEAYLTGTIDKTDGFLIGVNGFAENDAGASNAGSVTGGFFEGDANGGTVANGVTGLDVFSTVSGGTVTNGLGGIYVEPDITSGSADWRYGIFLATGSGTPSGAGTNDYGIYQESTSAVNYFGGNVGIGTTSPSAQLEVSNSGISSGIKLTDTANASNSLEIGNFGIGSGIVFDPQANGGNFYFGRNFKLNNFIIQSGNVGIGTTTPFGALHVRAAANNNMVFQNNTDMGTPTMLGIVLNDANNSIEPLEFVASAFNFAGGNVGIGTTAPQSLLDIEGGGGGQLTLGPGSGSNNAAIDLVARSGGTAETVELLANQTAGFQVNAPGNIGFSSSGSFNPFGGALLQVNNNVAIGAAYIDTSAPTNGLIVQGNVGIGTSTPTYKLHVYGGTLGVDSGSGTDTITLRDGSIHKTAGSGFQFDSAVSVVGGSAFGPGYSFTTDNNTGLYLPGTGILAFSTGANERARIDSSGNVGIGTTSPSQLLSLQAADARVLINGTSGLARIEYENNANPAWYAGLNNDGAANSWSLQNGAGTAVLVIQSTGNVGIGSASPAALLDAAGPVKLGTAGTTMTAMGTCTVASYTPTNTTANKTCTGVPASAAVAVNCSASAAFTTPATTVLYARATGTLSQIAVNLSASNSVAVSLTCMWVKP